MSNHNIDDLTKSLTKVRLDQKDLVRKLEPTNRRENELIRDKSAAEAAAIVAVALTTNQEAEENRNPYKKGQLVSITNSLQSRFGITGKVVRSGKVLVTILNDITGHTYTRTWFNILLHPSSNKK